MSVHRGVKTGCSMGGSIYKKVKCTQCDFYRRIPNTFNPHRKSKTVPYCTKKVRGSKCGWRLCSQYRPKAKKPKATKVRKGILQSDGSIVWED